MKAKNKQEFLEQLGRELNRIGIEDTGEIFADFEEHFADSAAQGISEEETAERLGDVKEIARSYLNLESSRINSIIARDVEHKRGVSLTKPGRSVPADLSLIKGTEAINSDCVRSYTPEHLSEEIYPNMSANSSASVPNGGFTGSSNGNTNGAGNANGANVGAAGAAAGSNVADAFSNAGRAAIDAAKVTGHAIADAFGQSGVKDAVIGAGKSAAEAVKTAGQSAAEAMRRAKAEHAQRTGVYNAPPHNDGVPRPNESFRANTNNDRKGTIPPQYGKAKTSGKGFKLINTAELKPHLNVGKFIGALLLDCLVWSWLIPAFIAVIFGGVFGGALGLFGNAIAALFGWGFGTYYFLSRLFLAIGMLSAVIIFIYVGIVFIKLLLRLLAFIINMHIRAIYDL
ncbi:MAG: DUF1700 domain-containing protein [Lachnospiraceae bacterium]|nr:DUF1700 domain-containing protein [Ruminococcus sp.]MCM1275845.1 DUF1700 domain-containing protein [Lachnospiraceae bacterium]